MVFRRFFIFILLANSVAISGMEVPTSRRRETQNNRVPLNTFHDVTANYNPEFEPSYISEEPNLEPHAFINQFDPDSIREIKYALEYAPDRAKQIVRHLKNKHFLNDGSFRVAIFWGEPGTGKTTTALGIAHEMSISNGWKHRFISCADVAEVHRNATAKALSKILKEISTERDTPTILIIDEMNELLENTESKNHDTNITSKMLWNFLDRQHNNHNFFCIGTMNRIHKLAKPFKDRYLSKCIEFTSFQDTTLRNEAFRKKLIDEHTQFHPEINNLQLNELLQPLDNCTGRNIADVVYLCRTFGRLHDPESTDLIIRTDNITQAIAEFQRMRVVGRYDQPEETDEEQRERHHIEQLAQSAQQFRIAQINQRRQFEANQATQEGLSQAQLAQARVHFEQQQRAQLVQFVQTIRAQAFTSTNQVNVGAGAGRGNGEGGNVNGSLSLGNIGFKDHLMNYVLTEEQLAINNEL